MPYIAFELDAMARAENVARSIGQPDTLIKGGLLNLWAHCFRETTDDVTPIQVRAFFGGDVVDALVAFGFLEPTSDTFRVRGAGRYLRLKKAYSEGAAKTNALRRRPKASDSVRPPSLSGRVEVPVLDALAASSEQRAPTSESTTSAPRKKRAPPTPAVDPRLTPLTAQLCEVDYPIVRREAYRHGGAKDALALKALLPIASDEEIRARWRKGLCATGWASCSTLAQLGAKWNDLAAPADTTKRPGRIGYEKWTEDEDPLVGLGGSR